MSMPMENPGGEILGLSNGWKKLLQGWRLIDCHYGYTLLDVSDEHMKQVKTCSLWVCFELMNTKRHRHTQNEHIQR